MKHRAAVILIAGAILCALVVRVPGTGTPAPQAMTSNEEASAWADKTLSGLSLERKIGQMITPDIQGGYITEDDPRLGGSCHGLDSRAGNEWTARNRVELDHSEGSSFSLS